MAVAEWMTQERPSPAPVLIHDPQRGRATLDRREHHCGIGHHRNSNDAVEVTGRNVLHTALDVQYSSPDVNGGIGDVGNESLAVAGNADLSVVEDVVCDSASLTGGIRNQPDLVSSRGHSVNLRGRGCGDGNDTALIRQPFQSAQRYPMCPRDWRLSTIF